MPFSAKRSAYSDMPSFSSQSAICATSAPPPQSRHSLTRLARQLRATNGDQHFIRSLRQLSQVAYLGLSLQALSQFSD